MLKEISMLVLSSVCFSLAAASSESGNGVPDTPFAQEYHEAYIIGEKAGANDVRAVAADGGGAVWAATKAGVYALKKGGKQWSAVMDTGPAFDVAVDADGTVWAGAWDGLYRSTSDGMERLEGDDSPISAVCVAQDGVVAFGPDGMWRVVEGEPTLEELACSRSIRAALPDPDGGLWIATGMSLLHHTDAGDARYQTEEEILSCDVHDVAYAPDGILWAGGFGGVTVYKDGKRAADFTTKEGLPSVYVRSVARGPDGRMWVGTDAGVARYDGKGWSLRHSRRWLLSDDVRDVAFDADGTAWIATSGGVSAIKRKAMTLSEKADYFQGVCMERNVRDPWLVEKCRLPVPGDTSEWEPEDDDNDGQYTAMYLVMESFRYAATKDPRAQANAKKAFDALRFLQTVTETPGFVARTVIPATWTRMHDPGDKFTDQEWAERRIADPRYKKVEVRWRPSSDGKWLWKGDTSSDEITGHFYGYHYYYDLAADEAERDRVRAHTAKVMDYIIDNGYVLVDIDGTHTRWAVWSPEKLNADPDWAPERGVNSVEILSYLKTTYHMTGDEKYQREYLSLLHEHGYAANVRHAKTYGPAWRTHIDDELLALAYPALLEYEKDPELLELYRESLDHWYPAVRHDCSPFFNFMYASLVGEDRQLDDSMAFLRDAPLDLVNWRIDNTKREDLSLERAPEIEELQTSRLVPASERGVMRWDKNPWQAVQGDGGHTEWCPTFWLLPYWMGRYYGFIEPPQKS